MNLATPAATLKILKKYRLRPVKFLGQNFLVDQNILGKIISIAHLNSSDIILEIGPGIGTLTQALAQKVRQVFAIEQDKNLLPVLEETLQKYPNVEIIYANALKLTPTILPELPNKMVSNLPYNIASPLLVTYLKNFSFLEDFVVMVQREVASRLAASPGSKSYGSLTLKVQFLCKVNKAFPVSRHVFLPKPKVDSTIVTLKRKAAKISLEETNLIFRVIETAFSKRRKTIVKALLAGGLNLTRNQLEKTFEEGQINPQNRAEQLKLEDYIVLAKQLKPHIG